MNSARFVTGQHPKMWVWQGSWKTAWTNSLQHPNLHHSPYYKHRIQPQQPVPCSDSPLRHIQVLLLPLDGPQLEPPPSWPNPCPKHWGPQYKGHKGCVDGRIHMVAPRGHSDRPRIGSASSVVGLVYLCKVVFFPEVLPINIAWLPPVMLVIHWITLRSDMLITITAAILRTPFLEGILVIETARSDDCLIFITGIPFHAGNTIGNLRECEREIYNVISNYPHPHQSWYPANYVVRQ